MSETLTAESPTERQKYRHFFRCRQCATRFHVDRLTPDPSKVKTPKCPRKSCTGKVKESFQADIGLDVSAGRFPMTPSTQATAFDTAHRWAMEEAGVTNIKDGVRPGESTAPPLEPRLQNLANGFWGGQRQQGKTRTARADLSAIYGERAIAAQAGQPAMGQRFTADQGVGIAPILTAKPTGTSPVPEHRVIGSFNPGR